MKPKVVMLAPTGLVVWALPDTTFEIMWAGPGSRLLFGHPRRTDGTIFPIHHPSADGVYMTRKEAEAAVAAFIAVPAVHEDEEGTYYHGEAEEAP